MANQTQHLIKAFGWEQLDNPLYYPNLAPSNYHMFLHLKKHLGGERHNNDDKVKTAVFEWLLRQEEEFFEDGIQKLIR